MLLKKVTLTFICALSAASAIAHEITQQEFNNLLKNAFRDNPELLLSGFKQTQSLVARMKDQEDKARLARLEQAVFFDPSTPVHNPNGVVKVVEFFDYRCGACKRVATAMKTLATEDQNVQIIYKPVAVLGETSSHLAKIALAVHKISPNQYPAYHSQLMSHPQPSVEIAYELAKLLNINSNTVADVANSIEIEDQLATNVQLFMDLGLTGTPTIFVERTKYPGVTALTTLRPEVRKYLNDESLRISKASFE
jgi:protein-disulfide isomerase